MGTSQTDLDLPLVRALQAGDESALNKLMRKYQEPLFWFIWRYTGDEEITRDLLQETFVRLYFGIRRFKPHAKFATWLYSIAMNLCRDYARSKQRRQSYATESLDAGDVHREVPAADRGPAADAESHEELAKAVRSRNARSFSASARRRWRPASIARASVWRTHCAQHAKLVGSGCKLRARRPLKEIECPSERRMKKPQMRKESWPPVSYDFSLRDFRRRSVDTL